MENRYKLSECEEMIMSILWAAEENLDLVTVTARVKDEFDKKWKLQTVATFMTRLEKKKYISIYRVGRYSHYHPVVSLDEYRKAKLDEVREVLFGDRQREMVDFINPWILVSKSLPDVHKKVLLSLRDSDVCTGHRMETDGYFWVESGGYVETQYVLAWQPLPDPYKIVDEEVADGKAN